MKTMTTSCDRTRLKDRILANVAKAIKCIQEFQILKGEESLVLTNSDWQCHKLCEHLDHAFLHGLRHVTHGYWKVVTDFTRKGAVQEILQLSHVTTDLGRGRAWLYVALNENLLESYMRCFMENSRYVKKYYVKEALVLDQQRLNVLVTLTSGLDYGTFRLEYNMPYLDLSSYQARPKPERTTSTQSEDKVSLCSMESSSSLLSSSMSSSMMSSDYMCHRSYHDGDLSRRRTYSASTDSGFQVEAGSTLLSSRHLSIPCDSSNRSASPHCDPFTRISRIEGIVNVSDQEEGENLEVIRVVKSKGENSKKKKKKLKKVIKKERNSICEREESEVTDSTEDASRATPSDDGQSENLISHGSHFVDDSTQGDLIRKVSKDDSGYGLCEETVSLEDETDSSIYGHRPQAAADRSSPAPSREKTPSAKDSSPELINDNPVFQNCNQISSNRTNENPQTALQGSDTSVLDSQHSISTTNGHDELQSTSSLREHSHNICSERMAGVDVPSPNSELVNSVFSDCGDEEQVTCDDIYSSSIPKGQGSSCLSRSRSNTADQQSKTEDITVVHQDINGDDEDVKSVIHKSDSKHEQPQEETGLDSAEDCSARVDNNTLLHLMLDVFENEDEQFVKLYSSRSGHTEGETTVIYLLVTDMALYLLGQSNSKAFKKDASIPYKELDYISLSMGDQVVQIVCTNRRKQFWVSTGDSALTKCFLSSVSGAMKASHLHLPKLTILTDATTQGIAMRKYVASETHAEPKDVKVLSYVLVHWEDPSSIRKEQSAYKEGHLLYRTKGINQSWKTAYMVLRDGVFCLYNMKADSKPHFFLKLTSEYCTGCRLLPSADRSHCLEIVVSKGSSLQLAAANKQEASSWLQVLCQAVSEGQQGSVGECRSSNCLPCCLVLTPQKILMCHEDVQTSFFRTLGSANVVDVTAVSEDPFVKTYCVLEFESQDIGISSNQWVLYFNAANEKKAFIEAFSGVWAEEFQVEVPVLHIQDVPLQTKCREMANYLRDTLKLK